jgi:hypothetical protein
VTDLGPTEPPKHRHHGAPRRRAGLLAQDLDAGCVTIYGSIGDAA